MIIISSQYELNKLLTPPPPPTSEFFTDFLYFFQIDKSQFAQIVKNIHISYFISSNEEDHYTGLLYVDCSGYGAMAQCRLIAGLSSTMLTHN